jgi:three-Cys-motif partner protein
MNPQSGRSWGYWTRAKLGILADYLDQFTVASSGQQERVYLDAFAGEGTGLDRLTGEEFKGSARLALESRDPGFTRLRFFEKGKRASELEGRLKSDYPGKDIVVHQGDCNVTIPAVLEELKPIRWAPTFAFLDPDGMEVSWETLEALADHKRGYRSPTAQKPEYKVELWMLFPSAGLVRTLALDEAKMTETDAQRASRLCGDESWRPIYERRVTETIDGRTAREEYVNLMRWRLQRDLGYRWTHPLELKNVRGLPLYHMIFATDNDAGTRIMQHLYGQALEDIPAMRQEAADRAKGQQTLELPGELMAGERYEYEPPWEPPTQTSDAGQARP